MKTVKILIVLALSTMVLSSCKNKQTKVPKVITNETNKQKSMTDLECIEKFYDNERKNPQRKKYNLLDLNEEHQYVTHINSCNGSWYHILVHVFGKKENNTFKVEYLKYTINNTFVPKEIGIVNTTKYYLKENGIKFDSINKDTIIMNIIVTKDESVSVKEIMVKDFKGQQLILKDNYYLDNHLYKNSIAQMNSLKTEHKECADVRFLNMYNIASFIENHDCSSRVSLK